MRSQFHCRVLQERPTASCWAGVISRLVRPRTALPRVPGSTWLREMFLRESFFRLEGEEPMAARKEAMLVAPIRVP